MVVSTIRRRVLVVLFGTLLLLVPASSPGPPRHRRLPVTGPSTKALGPRQRLLRGWTPLALQNGASSAPGVWTVRPLAVGLWPVRRGRARLIDTTRSFTVSAWVNLSNTDGYQTFVSQDGSQVSGFYLQLRGDNAPLRVHPDRLRLPRRARNDRLGVGDHPAAGRVVPPRRRLRLGKQTISLYVNGTLQQTQPFLPSWQASGPLAVGRSLFGGKKVDFVSGRIDDVRIYSGGVGAPAISRLAGPGRLTVDASQAGPAINSTQFGAFLEEINHSGDGGLYAELIRNRDLKEDSSSPVALVGGPEPRSERMIALDGGDPLNSANP